MPGDEAFAASVIDRYRVENELGRGGWGIVFAAHDIRLDRRVAIKLLREEYAGSLSTERFRREIGILSRLDHPNIVSLFDAGEFGNTLWYAMSLVQGETLRDRLERDKQLSIPESLRVARAVAEALAHAHAAGVVHRDIKPANILLSDDRVRVADFGVARALSTASLPQFTTSTGVQIGTPAYMSPEQASGDGTIDRRSDIYSLGCVLYEMLAGEPPFLGASSSTVIARHVLDPVPSLRTVRPSVSVRLEDAVYRMLAKSPADRFKNASELIAALDAAANEPEVSVSRERRRRSVGRSRVIGAIAIGLLGAGGWSAVNAIVHMNESRLIAQADTSRLAVFPASRNSSSRGGLPDIDARLRRIIGGWSGLGIVYASDFADEQQGGTYSPKQARTLAVEAQAARYMRTDYTMARDTLRIHGELFDAHDATAVLKSVDEVGITSPGWDAAIQRAVARLLVRDEYPSGPMANGSVHSLPAEQAFAAGWRSLKEWNLPAADSSFATARRFDPNNAHASLWLAQTRQWSLAKSPTWIFALDAASRSATQLSSSERLRIDALTAFSRNDRPRACEAWRRLAAADTLDFTAWYSAGDCLARDNAVVRGPGGARPWVFRTGYMTALAYYRRAFELNPAVLRSLQSGVFERVRRMFKTSGNDIRRGNAASPDTGTFIAYPTLLNDTLTFIPMRAAVMARADTAFIRQMPTNVGEAVDRQRRLFFEVATTWRSAEPLDPAAGEAVAVALSLLDDVSALDTIVKVRRTAHDPRQQLRLMSTQVWMDLQFGVGDSPKLLVACRALADSVLALSGDRVDPNTLASIAALTGRAFRTHQLIASVPAASNVTSVDRLAQSLLTFSAFGGPADTLSTLVAKLARAGAIKPQGDNPDNVVSVQLMRAASLAFPHYRMPFLDSIASTDDYLVSAELAFARGDTVQLRESLTRLQASRAKFALPDITFDALYPEAWLVAASGDKRRSAAWLDPALGTLRVQASLIDPIRSASLVQAMALRAELAASLGDAAEAARWARAVVALWSNADPFLQPLVARMKQFAR